MVDEQTIDLQNYNNMKLINDRNLTEWSSMFIEVYLRLLAHLNLKKVTYCLSISKKTYSFITRTNSTVHMYYINTT